MKILIIFLFLVGFVGTFFLADSHAQVKNLAPLTDTSLPEIVLQIEVRNSDGVLVSYIEPSMFYLRNIFLIHDYLDQKSEDKKTIVTINGKKYEEIEWRYKTKTMESWNQQSGYQIGHKGFGIISARLNGSISQEGDVVKAYWKITRPI